MKDLFSDDSLRYKQARPAYSAEIVQEILSMYLNELLPGIVVPVRGSLPSYWYHIFSRF